MAGPRAWAQEDFRTWLDGLRADARSAGISRAVLDSALTGLEPVPRVLELDGRQPESRLSFEEYRRDVVSADRVRRGREAFEREHLLLDEAHARYGVPARIIAALWGIESSFGAWHGSFEVIPSLATLAWQGRRTEMFRRELLSALRILQAGDVTREEMIGSWAGAMGQCQFMPSTFLSYAVDADGDGRRDLWNSLPDVFASAANYLVSAGWEPGERWGREVRPPPVSRNLPTGPGSARSLSRWSAAGIVLPDGASLPRGNLEATLIQPSGPGGPSFLVYRNFRTLMVWNRSTYFALSVGLLSDLIEDGAV